MEKDVSMNVSSIIAIISPFITGILGFLLKKYFNDRARLFAYYGHITSHKLKNCNPNIDIFTHSLVIINTGRIAAKNVRIGHHVLPEYDISPNIAHSEVLIPKNGKEILFTTLVPNEQVTIAYLYFPPITYQQVNAYIKSDEGYAKSVTTIPTINLKSWQKYFLCLLLFIGFSMVVYWIGLFIVYFYQYINE